MSKKPRNHWNYRVLASKFIDDREPEFDVYEVYYHEEVPYLYGTASTEAESLEDLKQNMKMMKKAFKKPILYKGDKFPQEYK